MKKQLAFLGFILLAIEAIGQLTIDKHFEIEKLKREDYTLIESVTGNAHGGKPMVLFIGFGPRGWKRLEEKAYKNAIANCGCDGIINPTYKHRSIPFTIILTTFVYKTVVVEGKGFKIKTGY